MVHFNQIFPTCLIECVAKARMPDITDLDLMAQKIWSDIQGLKDDHSWNELSTESPEREYMYHYAKLALMGNPLN